MALEAALEVGQVAVKKRDDFFRRMLAADVIEHIHGNRRVGGPRELERREMLAQNAEVFFSGVENRCAARAIAVDQRD